MKKLYIAVLWMFTLVSLLPAQGTEQHVENSEGRFTYHYFTGTTKVSTETFWPSGYGKGHAIALNRAGKEIYRRELSRHSLIQSVDFRYYDDGAVKSAHYSWHPDAGIQRGGNTTHFDPAGNVTSVVEDLDPNAPLTAPGRPSTQPYVTKPGDVNPNPQPKPQPQPVPRPAPQQEVVVEAPLYQTEYFIVNTTKKPLTLNLLDNQGKPLPPDKFKPQEIQSGDTLRGGSFINAGHHGNPCDYVKFQLTARKSRWLTATQVDCKGAVYRDLKPEHRQVFYFIQQTRRPYY